MSTLVEVVGWCALAYGFVRVVGYWRDARRELDLMSRDWFKEHEYREGKRGL